MFSPSIRPRPRSLPKTPIQVLSPPETDTDDEDLGLDLPDSPTEGDLGDASTRDEAPDTDVDTGEDLDLDLGLDFGEDTPEAGTTGRDIEDIDLDTDQIDEATAVAEMEDMDLSLDLDGPPAEKALPGSRGRSPGRTGFRPGIRGRRPFRRDGG